MLDRLLRWRSVSGCLSEMKVAHRALDENLQRDVDEVRVQRPENCLIRSE
jgi:hypothetical protein